MSTTTRTQRLARLARGIQRVEGRLRVTQQLGSRLGWARLGVFLLTLAGAYGLGQVNGAAGAAALVVGLAAFGVLVGRHRRVKAIHERYAGWLSIQRTHVARAELDWAHIPKLPNFTARVDHPFETDLDIGGEHSLHQLLDTSATLQGSARLRDSLLATAPDGTAVKARHGLLDEMPVAFADQLALRARLTYEGRGKLDTRPLLAWMAAEGDGGVSGRYVATLAALCVITAVLFVLRQAAGIPPYFAISFVIYFGLSLMRLRSAVGVLSEAFTVQEMVSSLYGVFSYLERHSWARQPQMRALTQPFHNADRPSRALRRLRLIVGAASLRNNYLVWGTLNAIMPWDMFTTYQMGQQRRKLARLLPGWVEVWAELEALAALRLFAYLNPDYTRPIITREGMVMAARQLGHPLIDHGQRVCNDFVMDTTRVTMITGSNMSGKSSFLRTLGVNLVLANAGAVVNAAEMQVSSFRVYTCIKVSDSLADGFSYFYAEVRRLAQLLQALEKREDQPLFFLIDEIFKGTNNRERLLGSEAYIRALAGKHGTGAISTHDLELASLPDLANYHFADRVEDGQLRFDYRLREGVSPTTNALRIMMMAGLPIHE